ncbi:YhgE/Pip family protein [Polaromonas sp. P1-6]|nr:YhgE/Pip family protein [Polaromonas sp. P1-6]
MALVNLDEGIRYRGRDDNVGRELGDSLVGKGMFGWRPMADAESARRAVSAGELAFAVIIPKDFSAQAVPGTVAGGGEIRVILSEGNNYSSAGLARRFAIELGHQVNETLNEKRWALVLSSSDGSQKSFSQLKAGVTQLRGGANALSGGSVQYSATAMELSSGMRQMASGVRAMESRLPAETDLKALKAGSQQLAAGQRDLGRGLEQLQTGAGRLADGTRRMQEESASVPFFGDDLSDGAGKLAEGAVQLGDGLGRARSANEQLAQGATQLDTGVVRLAEGVNELGNGVRTLSARLPTDEQLNAFSAGGKSLAEGAAQVLAGVKLLDSSLPASVGTIDGSARGLADSVQPVLENLAPVPNLGSAYAPNMVGLALWIGAVMAVYLFNLSQMPASLANAPRLAQSLGKLVVPAGITLLQTLLAFVLLVLGLGVRVPSPGHLVLTMAIASWVFLAMLFALLRVFGEAGKLLSVLLLTLQMAAGGGVIPVELSGGLFQTVHHWLPFTWVVKAFRASLFGAYDHGWAHAMGAVVLSGGVSLLLAAFVGRWRFVPDAEHRPAIET